MRFKKIYLEISNVCNLDCSFCHKTKRSPRIMKRDELELILRKIRPYTEYLYFHLMGEPLCHPDLEHFLSLAEKYAFKVIITTNGVLLNEKKDILFSSPALHKINVPLHAFEANDLPIPFEKYRQSLHLTTSSTSAVGILVISGIYSSPQSHQVSHLPLIWCRQVSH